MSVVVLGLLLCALAVLPAALAWAIYRPGALTEHVLALARRLHLLPPPPVLTFDPPLERIAATLRRLSAEMRHLRRGTSAVRRRGLQMAYDDTLIAACRALEVPNELSDLPEGMERKVERLRVETELMRAGLSFRPPDEP
jgi:hypothetical protein